VECLVVGSVLALRSRWQPPANFKGPADLVWRSLLGEVCMYEDTIIMRPSSVIYMYFWDAHFLFHIAFYRYINRFFGLPAAIQGARNEGSWGPGMIGKILAWSMIGYYPLEHLAYLKWKSPSLVGGASRGGMSASKASAWSCRFWFLYIVVDMIQSQRALQQIQETTKDKSSRQTDELSQLMQQRRYHRLQLLRNALFSLPAIHWSLPKWDTDPWLSNDLVNGLMWLESLVSMYQSVRS
jgi:hypothetical protein